MQHRETSSSKPYTEKYIEIITKGVSGSAKNFVITRYIDLPEDQCPTDVLGTTITNLKLANKNVHSESMSSQESGVSISGALEIQVWYAYNNGKATEVKRHNVIFEEFIPIPDFEKDFIRLIDVRVEIVKSPECESSITKDNKISIDVEMGIYAEIVGETKVSACIYQPGGEEHDG
jgi:spore coat protein E